MKITERRLRAIIKSVIKENSSSPAYQHDWMMWADSQGNNSDAIEEFAKICQSVFRDDYQSLARFIIENVPGHPEEIVSMIDNYGYSKSYPAIR